MQSIFGGVALLLVLFLSAPAWAAGSPKGSGTEDDSLDIAKVPNYKGWVDKLVSDVKNGKKTPFASSKATVLSNQNVLNHKSNNKAGDFEMKMKRTKEEGNKSKAEDRKKKNMEERQKRLEDKSKRDIQEKKRKLRENNRKLESEEDKKTAKEAKRKALEAGQKRKFEQRTKKAVEAAQKKAREAQKKAYHSLDEERKKEGTKKTRLEKNQKSMIHEAHFKAESKRKQARQEIEHKKRQEKKRKENRKKKEKLQKDKEKRKETDEKDRRRKATGKWCGCQQIRVDWRQNNQWLECPAGSLVTGIYRGQYQNLANIYYYRCCSPCKDTGDKRMAVTSCTVGNWWSSFDRAGWSMCPGNTFIKGFYKSTCNWIYCLEMARCCYISGSRGRKACKANKAWGQSFNRQGWSYLSKNTFMVGLYRTHQHYLNNIEFANECSYYAYT